MDSSSWFEDFGAACQRDPRIFLTLDKLSPVKQELGEKFAKVANYKKKATNALLAWSDICRLGDLPHYF